MALILGTGFEECSTVTELTSVSGFVVTGSSGMTLDTGTKHSGAKSLKIAPVANAPTHVRRDTANTSTPGLAIYSRRYINFVSFGSAIDPTIFETVSSGNVQSLMVRIMRTGVLRLENVVTAHTVDMTTVLSLGVDYRIETKHVLSDTVGTMEMRLYLGDSTSLLESVQTNGGTPEDTLATNNALYAFGQRTNPSSTCVFFMDDIVLNDSLGTFANDWPGPGKHYTSTVNTDIGGVAWTKDGSSPAASNFDGVDEVPAGVPDDAVTYNSSTSTSAEDKLFLTDPPVEVPANATMLYMDVWARISAPDAVSGTFALKIWDNLGTGTQGPTITVSSATWSPTTVAQHTSASLIGKSKNDLFSHAIGYKALSGASRKAVTAIWANIGWTETPAGARVPLRYMLRPQ